MERNVGELEIFMPSKFQLRATLGTQFDKKTLKSKLMKIAKRLMCISLVKYSEPALHVGLRYVNKLLSMERTADHRDGKHHRFVPAIV